MKTINQHGETVEVIGSVADGKGGRCDITLVEWSSANGRKYISLHGRHTNRDFVRRFAAVRMAKRVDVVEKFDQITRIGRMRKSYDPNRNRPTHYKIRYEWVCSKHENIGMLLQMLWPWLGKRRQAKIIEVYNAVHASKMGIKRKNVRSWGWVPGNLQTAG